MAISENREPLHTPTGKDTEVQHPVEQPSVARMYDFYLGGTSSRAIDRDAVAEVAKAMPDCFDLCLENRSFLRRAVRYMASQGVTQFVDIGSGLPTVSNTHEIAQSINPDAKVLYVDMDPAVLELGQKLLAPNKSTAIICADIRNPHEVFAHPDFNRLIDSTKPIGILMMCVACFFTEPEISSIMGDIRSVICEDSYVAVTHDTLDGHRNEKEKIARVQKIYSETPIPIYFRNHDEVSKIFEGLRLVDPGVVMLDEWHIGLDLPAPAAVRWLYGGVGRKHQLTSHAVN
ncbi:hypothetical protein N7471_003409 [Penicillium samsonianum]|uniref:uncharacterized protein n=1 Tax=Penicillium samsonianum TaxID=1882272 RepID=UPI0025483386|nr:uncharacterized protein N7471_003409 [Penicillium samsonianum]KAJ6143956.1 hypothetical protein N7471_003409 [Penicillium samsonianum]